MKRIGIGLLGAGWMGELHTGAYKRVLDHYPDLGVEPRLVIAADQTSERALDARDRLGDAGARTHWGEGSAHPDVDAVGITPPNFMPRERARAAAAAGKHFWGEKPLGRFPAETAEI